MALTGRSDYFFSLIAMAFTSQINSARWIFYNAERRLLQGGNGWVDPKVTSRLISNDNIPYCVLCSQYPGYWISDMSAARNLSCGQLGGDLAGSVHTDTPN